MSPSSPIKPPSSGAQLRRLLVQQYGISSANGLAFIDAAARALDQARAAEKILKREGLTTGGARGLRAHPAVKIAHDAWQRVFAALRALDLKVRD